MKTILRRLRAYVADHRQPTYPPELTARVRSVLEGRRRPELSEDAWLAQQW